MANTKQLPAHRTVGFRMSKKEYAALQKLAKGENRTVSQQLRHLVARALA